MSYRNLRLFIASSFALACLALIALVVVLAAKGGYNEEEMLIIITIVGSLFIPFFVPMIIHFLSRTPPVNEKPPTPLLMIPILTLILYVIFTFAAILMKAFAILSFFGTIKYLLFVNTLSSAALSVIVKKVFLEPINNNSENANFQKLPSSNYSK